MDSGLSMHMVDFWSCALPLCLRLQPWTILLSGSLVVTGAWQLSGQNLLVAGAVAIPILAWWYLFLVLVPQAYEGGALDEDSVAGQAARDIRDQRGPQ